MTTIEEFHKRIMNQQFFEEDMDNPRKGEWWHSSNGESYCEIGDILVNKGFTYQEALDILGMCHSRTKDEYGQ